MGDIENKCVLFLLHVLPRVIQGPVTLALTCAVSTRRMDAFSVNTLWRNTPTVWWGRISDKLFLPAEPALTKEEICTRKLYNITFPLNPLFLIICAFYWWEQKGNMKIVRVIVVIMNAEKGKYLSKITRPCQQNLIPLLRSLSLYQAL